PSVRVEFNNTGFDYSLSPQPIAVNGIDGGALSMGMGTVTTPLIRLGVTGLQVTIANALNVGGNFEFEKSTTQAGTSVIKATVSNFHVILGDGTTNYVVLQQGPSDFGALMFTDAGLAGTITVGLTIENIP